MIKVFGKNDKNFASNGDVILLPLKAKVYKQDNGDFYLDFECGLEYIDYIVEDNIIVAPTPQGEQAFRIRNVEKTKSKLTTRAYHVFYDSENFVIADSYVVEKDCAEALEHLNSATDTLSPFETTSDIATVDSLRCVRKSLAEAINLVLERWGGHLYRNNFTIGILSSIGQDNGITVRYAKNLKEISCSEDWSEVVTKLLAVGKDGILLNEFDSSVDIYVYSTTTYSVPYTKVVSFEQDINEEDYETEEAYKQALVNDLRTQAQAYVDANCVPKMYYTLKANLDKITDVGDTVEVIDERLGIDLMTSVIAFQYDCILGKYTEIEFGNFQKTLSNLLSTITAETTKTNTMQIQNAVDPIWSTLEKSYVVFDGAKILVLDDLPKENAQNVIKIDSQGIQFGQDGISGTFNTSWAIGGTFKPYNNEALVDYIIEEGTSGIWKYRKHSSGLVELDGVDSVTSISSWTSFDTVLYYANRAVAYPFNVTNAIITANIGTDSSISWIANAKADSASQTMLTVVRNATSGGFTINIHVVGKWR